MSTRTSAPPRSPVQMSCDPKRNEAIGRIMLILFSQSTEFVCDFADELQILLTAPDPARLKLVRFLHFQ